MKFKNILKLSILGITGSSLYQLPYLKYYFYNQMIENTGFSGESLGVFLSMFGISSILVLFPGGILVDRYSSVTCIIASLISTTLLIVFYSFFYHSFTFSCVIWFLLAFSSLFLAWPAIFKLIRIIGEEKAGTAYGVYYASTGLSGAIIGFFVLKLYKFLSIHNLPNPYFLCILFLAALNIAVCLVFFFLFKNFNETKEKTAQIPTLKDTYLLLKSPFIWVISAILFGIYSLHIGITFFTSYLTDVFRISNETSGMFTLVRSYVFMSITPFTGLIADKFLKSTIKLFLFAYVVIIISLIFIILNVINADYKNVIIALTFVIAFFSCCIYASMFSVLSECKVPVSIAGTAIGIVSVFAYTPDVFMQQLFGHFADMNSYNSIFTILAILSFFSWLFCIVLFFMKKNNKKVV